MTTPQQIDIQQLVIWLGQKDWTIYLLTQEIAALKAQLTARVGMEAK